MDSTNDFECLCVYIYCFRRKFTPSLFFTSTIISFYVQGLPVTAIREIKILKKLSGVPLGPQGYSNDASQSYSILQGNPGPLGNYGHTRSGKVNGHGSGNIVSPLNGSQDSDEDAGYTLPKSYQPVVSGPLESWDNNGMVGFFGVVTSKGSEFLDEDDVWIGGVNKGRNEPQPEVTAAEGAAVGAGGSVTSATLTGAASSALGSTLSSSGMVTGVAVSAVALREEAKLKKEREKKEKKERKEKEDKEKEKIKGNLFLVLEYLPHDLTGLLDMAIPIKPVYQKYIFNQLLVTLEFIHRMGYVHRDLKCSNILVDNNYRYDRTRAVMLVGKKC